jgi:hypothetical protein
MACLLFEFEGMILTVSRIRSTTVIAASVHTVRPPACSPTSGRVYPHVVSLQVLAESVTSPSASPSLGAFYLTATSRAGEGQTPEFFVTETTGTTGTVTFKATTSVMFPSGQFVTAIATDAKNDTSEFSACVPIEH